MLPFMAGQEKMLTIYNPCPFPVEFYCKELDKQHVYEDEIIAHVEEFDRADGVRFPVRKKLSEIWNETLPIFEINNTRK